MSCANARLGFKMSGHVTNANYSVKRLQFILFINRSLPSLSLIDVCVCVVCVWFVCVCCVCVCVCVLCVCVVCVCVVCVCAQIDWSIVRPLERP